MAKKDDLMKIRIPSGLMYSLGYPFFEAGRVAEMNGADAGIKHLFKEITGFSLETMKMDMSQLQSTYIPIIISLIKHKVMKRANDDLRRAGIPFLSI